MASEFEKVFRRWFGYSHLWDCPYYPFGPRCTCKQIRSQEDSNG